ncbi:MAG: hypothetical protein JO281_04600 [Pseudonocardiales bacterium]|nr:hypothetical protein [Pseudonocardiales bacterium]
MRCKSVAEAITHQLLHQQTGPCEERRHIQTRTWAAEADYPHVHQAAQLAQRRAAASCPVMLR